MLSRLVKRGALPIKKLLDSAIANAGVPANELVIKDATVNKGLVIKRWMPRAMGRAFPIHKHTSKVSLVLVAKVEAKEAKEAKKPVAEKAVAKKAVKKAVK
jgi:large subunit ribosomal protein L22